MEAIIKQIRLQKFKGVRDATYQFGKRTSIKGANGAGKTTLASSVYWVLSDCDYALKNNPPIFPLNVEECSPTVRIWLDIDGRDVEIARTQHKVLKKSKTGGADSITYSNTYEVNSVEYGLRDFRAKMEEYGFDFDLLLPLSHPDVFTGKRSDEMRKILFSMAIKKSDKEIADQADGASDVAALLGNYTAEEVKAMQNATLRKIREEYGKEGEILRAKIEGLEAARVDIDVAELELLRNGLKEQIAVNKAKQEDISKQYEEIQKSSDGLMELKFALGDLQRKASEERSKKRKQLEDDIYELKRSVEEAIKNIQRGNDEIKKAQENIEETQAELESVREQWKTNNVMQFDKREEICQMCGQKLPQDKLDNLMREFEGRKEKVLADITKKGEQLKKIVIIERERIEKLGQGITEHENDKIDAEKRLTRLEEKYKDILQNIDITGTEEYKSLQAQIAEKEKTVQQGNSADEIRQQLKADYEGLQEQLTEVERQIAKVENNVRIDEQIEELRAKQAEYEQSKADCEKILYQLELVSRKKNELLQSDINSNFELVDFKLWDWQKNGEYKEVCIPTYRNKDMGISTNTGLEILMKLDIIRGLQRFYGMYFPVLMDGAESLSESSLKQVDIDCQIIFLVVDEGELKVEI